jgi:hypothetical protein
MVSIKVEYLVYMELSINRLSRLTNIVENTHCRSEVELLTNFEGSVSEKYPYRLSSSPF